jgi:trehalose 6-phosphate synthase
MSLLVVSNRVARPRADQPIEGGLAAALLPAVETSGAIWVGASQCLQDSGDKESFAQIEAFGSGAIATVDMPKAHYRGYYEGFSNSALWPILHSRTDLINATHDDYFSYRKINAFMAQALVRFAKPDTKFWIHDYHFLFLAAELRRLGMNQPIGFFLHTPFPAPGIFTSLTYHRELVRAMLSYDLIGFQTDNDRVNFADYLDRELGLEASGGVYPIDGRAVRLATFPIGIDTKKFAERAAEAITRKEISRLRTSLQGAKLAIGVDRVDYSKGLANRLQAFGRMLEIRPTLKRGVAMLQIAVPSRGQIEAYQHLQTELAELVSKINGRHGEVDWSPIRYLNKGFSQAKLAGFYRAADVGLVTSLHDGMNLVAKEYVAAQDPADPGVLVLSEFAGAAKQLDAAVLVNPHDIDGLAQSISDAFVMPREERRDRWSQMMKTLENSSLQSWFSNFVAALGNRRQLSNIFPQKPTIVRQLEPRRIAVTAGALRG